MLFAAQSDLLWFHTNAHTSLSAGKVGASTQTPVPAPITLRLPLWVVWMQSRQSGSLRAWMEKAGFQPSMFNKDTTVGNKKLRSGSWNLTSAEQAVQRLSSKKENPVELDRK